MGIPEISGKKVKELYERIKPVVRYIKTNPTCSECGHVEKQTYETDPRGKLYYIKDVNPQNVAFTWDPEPTRIAKGLRKLEDIVTYHSYAYYGFFKPSIAEVLAQIPEKYLSRVVAFETSTKHIELNGEYHTTVTTLYEKSRG